MLSPIETTAENPTPCADAHSTNPAAMAPDWETSARSPAGGIEAAKLALSLTPGTSTPRQFGPDKAHPCRARDRPALIGKRAGTVAKSCGKNDAERRALLRRCRDRGRHGNRGHNDDGDIGHFRQLVIGFARWNALDRIVARIDEMNGAGKTAAAKVPEYGMTGG